MDSNRDGTIDLASDADDAGEHEWEYGDSALARGAVITFNNDDDDGDGVFDAYDSRTSFSDGPDLAPLRVMRVRPGGLPQGWFLRVRPEWGADKVRIFDSRTDGAVVLWDPARPNDPGNGVIPSDAIVGNGWAEFGIEALSNPGSRQVPGHGAADLWLALHQAPFEGDISLRLEMCDDTGGVRVADTVHCRVAPWVMLSHADPVTAVYVPTKIGPRPASDPAGPAPAFFDRIRLALGAQQGLVRAITTEDPWAQDQFEIGFHARPDAWQNAVLNSPRNRSDLVLRHFAEASLLGENFGYAGRHGSLDGSVQEADQQSFGNLECSPHNANFGSVYHGNLLHTQLRDFLAAQSQFLATTHLDTSWLLVGHVDEMMSLAQVGEEIVLFRADPLAAVQVLLDNPHHILGQGEIWSAEAPPVNVIDFLTDGGLDANFAADYMISEQIAHYRNSSPNAVVRVVSVPVLYRNELNNRKGAALANAVNMLNVNGLLVVPDPRWAPMQDAVRGALEREGFQVRFVDCIELYRSSGQVHCGTNARREPRDAARRWWLGDHERSRSHAAN